VTDVPLPSWCTLVRADNPGPMTLEGTNTYVLRAPGAKGAVVVDPGPLDSKHLAAVAALGPVQLILLTHGHADHSGGASLFQEMTGAPMTAVDLQFVVDENPLTGSDTFLDVGGLGIRVLRTPGHTSDSVSFLVDDDEPAVLTGDTVLGRGTTVVAHPDGRLGAYLDSLQRLHALAESQEVTAVWPGHGPVIDDALAVLDHYLAHRQQRLEQVREAVRDLAPGSDEEPGEGLARRVVERVYADVDPVLWGAAELSVRAPIDYLRGR
jgi:glyoxylase-like metal-dependent hydrolase (beta-lactamase superfamily II)